MIPKEQIRALMLDTENDRVERTISTTNTDKFGQAICAMANDLPGHNMPGYLMLGVTDDGQVSGIEVTDDLLKNIAAIRTDGNIQPQPSMVVEKVPFPEGDIIVVEVQPHIFPPVRYKGRIWTRIGPRKGVANEADERILMEKRRANVTTWDASPCLNATIDDLDLSLFKHYFLPKAMSEADLEADNRDIKYQLSSFGFFDTRYDCPTNAGVLFFAKNLRRLVGGAYVQYVRFAGKDRAADITAEHEFKENLCTILPELDVFIKTGIAKRRPIPVSALREEMVADYPDWATRELLINAICHRDYTSNGPIQFYEYDDRIEIENHGGLYGRANEQNFPNVNDYRNMVVAEAMKVLGFANRQSRGVLRVQRDLVANENGEAIFDFGFQTAVLVRVMKSLRGDRLTQSAIENGLLMAENEGKGAQMAENVAENVAEKERKGSEMTQNMTKNEGKRSEMTQSEEKKSLASLNLFPTITIKNVLDAIRLNRKAKYSWLADNLGVSEATVKRAINWLKDNGYMPKEHAKIKGEWQIK